MIPRYWREGEPYVWATGLALSLVLLLSGLLLYVVIANGIAVFWPQPVALARLVDDSAIMGEIVQQETNPETDQNRLQFKIGNRDLYGLDFRWQDEKGIRKLSYPAEAYVLERMEYGNFYGFLKGFVLDDDPAPQTLQAALETIEANQEERSRLQGIISRQNNRMEGLQHRLAKLEHQDQGQGELARALLREKESLETEFNETVSELDQVAARLHSRKAIFVDVTGAEKQIVLDDIVRHYRPNAMSVFAKIGYYLARLHELLFDEPRESNTEGGLFPAIFGTIMLVFLMSILSFPLGVLGGIYLREYAKEGVLVKMVRIAVNNLAGIPSIVYGIFGLGFFVYGIGGWIDQFFFPERLPTPTFGTGGILWSSLTLGLLTVPVVIVATEEALGAIPPGIREGSQALAATKFQTLSKLLLPMASPGILTGFILAMARAAGEVAPLMITGVVKLAPALPLDGSFPFLHLDRKFMHLGFHIYDIGFQSPNVEAAKPMVYVTTLLLILIVLIMTSTAIALRNRMRKRYAVVDI